MSERLTRAYETLIHGPKEKDAVTAQATNTSAAATVKYQAKADDRLTACRLLVELVTSTEIINSKDFQQLLGLAVTGLLKAHNDIESAVRLLASECLNLVIKTFAERCLWFIQIDLFKHIKTPSGSRSLRAALSRFSDLLSRTRPKKRVTLAKATLPILVSLVRDRENIALQEMLTEELPCILAGFSGVIELGQANNLADALTSNLRGPSSPVQRAAAAGLTALAQHSPIGLTTIMDKLLYLLRTHIDTTLAQLVRNASALSASEAQLADLFISTQPQFDTSDHFNKSVTYNLPGSATSYNKSGKYNLEPLQFLGSKEYWSLATDLQGTLTALRLLIETATNAIRSELAAERTALLTGTSALTIDVTDTSLPAGRGATDSFSESIHEKKGSPSYAESLSSFTSTYASSMYHEAVASPTDSPSNSPPDLSRPAFLSRSTSDASTTAPSISTISNVSMTPPRDTRLWSHRFSELIWAISAVLQGSDQNVLTAALEVLLVLWPFLSTIQNIDREGVVEVFVPICTYRVISLLLAPAGARSRVLVSIKALCLSNLSALIESRPAWAYTMIQVSSPDSTTKTDSSTSSITLIHAIERLHVAEDPLVIGQVATVLSCFVIAYIQTASVTDKEFRLRLTQGDERIEAFLCDRIHGEWIPSADAPLLSHPTIPIQPLLHTINQLLNVAEPVPRRLAAQAAAQVIPVLLLSSMADLAVPLLEQMLLLAEDSYWLVRAEVVRLLSVLDLRDVEIAEIRHESIRIAPSAGVTLMTFEQQMPYHQRLPLARRTFNQLTNQLKHPHPRLQSLVARAFASLLPRLHPQVLDLQRRPTLPTWIGLVANQASTVLPSLLTERQRLASRNQSDAASYIFSVLVQKLLPDLDDGSIPSHSTELGTYLTLGAVSLALIFPDLPSQSFPPPPAIVLLHTLIPRLNATSTATLHSRATVWSPDGWQAILPWLEDIIPRALNCVIYDWAATDLNAHSLLLSLLVVLLSPAAAMLSTGAATADMPDISPNVLSLRRRYAWPLLQHTLRLLRLLSAVIAVLPASTIIRADLSNAADIKHLFQNPPAANLDTKTTDTNLTSPSVMFTSRANITSQPSPLPNSTVPSLGDTTDIHDMATASPQYARLGQLLQNTYRSWCLSLRSAAGSSTDKAGSSDSAAGAGGAATAGASNNSGGIAGDFGAAFGTQGRGSGIHGGGAESLPSWQLDPLNDDVLSTWVGTVVDAFVVTLWMFTVAPDEGQVASALVAAQLDDIVSHLMAASRFAPASCSLAAALILRVAMIGQPSANNQPLSPQQAVGTSSINFESSTSFFGALENVHVGSRGRSLTSGTPSSVSANSTATGTITDDVRDLVATVIERPAVSLSHSLLAPLTHSRSQGALANRRPLSFLRPKTLFPTNQANSSQIYDTSAKSNTGTNEQVHTDASEPLEPPAFPLMVTMTRAETSDATGQPVRRPATLATTSVAATALPRSSGTIRTPLSSAVVALSSTVAASGASSPGSTSPAISSITALSTSPSTSISSYFTPLASSPAASPLQVSTAAAITASAGTNNFGPVVFESVNPALSTIATTTNSPLTIVKPLILTAMRAYKERRDVTTGIAALFMVRDALRSARLNFVSDNAFLLQQLNENGTTGTADPTRVLPLVTELCITLQNVAVTTVQLTTSPWSTTRAAPAKKALRVAPSLEQVAYEIEVADNRDLSLGMLSLASCRLRQLLPLLEAVLAAVPTPGTNTNTSSSEETLQSKYSTNADSRLSSLSSLLSSVSTFTAVSSRSALEQRMFSLLLRLAPRTPLALAPLADLLRTFRHVPEKYNVWSEDVVVNLLRWLSCSQLTLRDVDDMAAAGAVIAAVAPISWQRPPDRLLLTLKSIGATLSGSSQSAALALNADRWLPVISLLMQPLCRLPNNILVEGLAAGNQSDSFPEQQLLEILLNWIETGTMWATTQRLPRPSQTSDDLGWFSLPFPLVCFCEVLQYSVFIVQGSDAALATPAYTAAANTPSCLAQLIRINQLITPLASIFPSVILRWQHLLLALTGGTNLDLWAPMLSFMFPYHPPRNDTPSIPPVVSSQITLSRGAIVPLAQIIGLSALTLILHRCIHIDNVPLGPLPSDSSILHWAYETQPAALIDSLLCLADQTAVRSLCASPVSPTWLATALRNRWLQRPTLPMPPRPSQLDRRLVSLLMLLPSQFSDIDVQPTTAQWLYPSMRRLFHKAQAAAPNSTGQTQLINGEGLSLPTTLSPPTWLELTKAALLDRLGVPSWPNLQSDTHGFQAVATALERGNALIPTLNHLKESAKMNLSTSPWEFCLWSSLIGTSLQRHLRTDRDAQQSSEQISMYTQFEDMLIGRVRDMLQVAVEQRDVLTSLTLSYVALALLPLLRDQVDPLRLIEAIGLPLLLQFWSNWSECVLSPPVLPHALRLVLRASVRLASWWVEVATSPSRLSNTIMVADGVAESWLKCEISLFHLIQSTELAASLTSLSTSEQRINKLQLWLSSLRFSNTFINDKDALIRELCRLHALELYVAAMRKQEIIPLARAEDVSTDASAIMTAAAQEIKQLDDDQRTASTKMDLMYLSPIFAISRVVGWTPGPQLEVLQRLARSCLWLTAEDQVSIPTPVISSSSSFSFFPPPPIDKKAVAMVESVAAQSLQPDDVLVEIGSIRTLTSLLLLSLSGTPGSPAAPLIHFPREFRLPLLRSRPGGKLLRLRRHIDARAQMLLLADEGSVYLPDLQDGVFWDTYMTSAEGPSHAMTYIHFENIERPLGSLRSRLAPSQLPVAALVHANPYENVAVPDNISVSQEDERARANTTYRPPPASLLVMLKRQHAANQVSGLLPPTLSLLQAYVQCGDRLSIALPLEAVKAIVLLSDLFRTSSEHEFAVSLFSSVVKTQPAEDTLMLPWATLGLCKSLSALESTVAATSAQIGEVNAALDKLLIIQRGGCFNHTAALASVLYLLEGKAKAIIRPALPNLLRFLSTQILVAGSSSLSLTGLNLLSSINSTTSSATVPLPTPVLSMALNVALTLIETFPAEVEQMDFARKIVAAAAALAFRTDCPEQIYHTVLRGLERLLLSVSLPSALRQSILSLTSNSVGSSRSDLPLSRAIAADGLMVTSLYSSLATSVLTTETNSVSSLTSKSMSSIGDKPLPNNQVIDRIMPLFERLSIGSTAEAVIVVDYLPGILLDTLSIENVLTMIMGEFVTQASRKPYLAVVIFKVFRRLNISNHQVLVRWILLSLNAFLQKPLSLSLWAITCLFVAVSPDPFLQALQPLLLSQGHLHTPLHYRWFLTSALHFFSRELHSEPEQKDFLVVFSSFAEQSPFTELLVLCKQLQATPDAQLVHFSGSDSI